MKKSEYFVLFAIQFTVFGFSSKEEADIYFQENTATLNTLHKKFGGSNEPPAVLSQKELEAIIIRDFWDKTDNYKQYKRYYTSPQWIEKTKDLKIYFKDYLN